MRDTLVDANTLDQICFLGQKVLDGGEITREEALFLLNLQTTSDILSLMSWANRIREKNKGNQIHLCSIVNIKAGGCSENCRFCAQSAFYETPSPRYELVETDSLKQAVEESAKNQVTGLGIVAAWKGLREGPVLDRVCEQIELLAENGKVRADASLGMIQSQEVANRLKKSGLACYNHNLETSRRFFSSSLFKPHL